MITELILQAPRKGQPPTEFGTKDSSFSILSMAALLIQ